ncbi:MAG: glycoside hydrolase family 125 protein [Clostridia bacterium]|nr:glycoside hydrolase family 125 protein [Clostridia bacterium]
MKIPTVLKERIDYYSEKLKQYPKLCKLYINCCPNTIETALEECEDGTYFVLTGDIPAMWLRDSTAQVTHYIPLAEDTEIRKIIEGVIRRQLMYIETDPYANAFNKTPNGKGHINDMPKQGPWVFERKYEIDSLCYPIRLLYLYWKQTGIDEIIKEKLEKIAKIIINQWKTEQYHVERSPYIFIRPDYTVPWDTIHNDGKGNPVTYTGMTWSGFRPSDDGCQYGYLTASEMFAVVVLGYMCEMLKCVCKNEALAAECEELRNQIDVGIKKYCIVDNEKYGKIYACETDGMGNYSMIDDANIPSLLSIPYIGYADAEDEIYQNTRKFLLSSDNPFYFEGKYAKGIGSRHTPENYVWHMALVMQGMTATDNNEKREILEMIANTDADTGYLHEGFNVDNPCEFTREWFTWPNSLFSEFIEECVDNKVI